MEFFNSVRSTREIADRIELENEKDIGEGLAERIITYRNEVGAFSRPEQLQDVKGIGKKRFQQILRSFK